MDANDGAFRGHFVQGGAVSPDGSNRLVAQNVSNNASVCFDYRANGTRLGGGSLGVGSLGGLTEGLTEGLNEVPRLKANERKCEVL